MKKKKCIIFSRVSTLGQDCSEQTHSLRLLAESYGYLPENHYIIEQKESGYQTEKERLGLNKLKDIILNHQVDCVFCREVSRLARSTKVLFGILNFLLHNKIQLIILEPRIELLNEDGTVNNSGVTDFCWHAQLIESSWHIIKNRLKEGKNRCRREGRWDGTPLPVGYSADASGFVIVDETADIVRTIFDMYATAEWSETTLAKELNKRDITINRSPITQTMVSRILMCERYCGEDIYPKIISRELFEAVKKLRVNGRVLRKNNYASKYLCNRLIVCPECGRHYTASNTTYRCCLHHENGSLCHNNIEISISLIDDIVWLCASDIEQKIARVQDMKTLSIKKKRDIVRTHIKEVQISEWKYKIVDFPKSNLTVEIKRKKYMIFAVIDKYGYTRQFEYYPKWTFGKRKCIEITDKKVEVG